MKLADNELLRELILKRLDELDWKDRDLLNDADERHYKIAASRFSKWRNKKKQSLSDTDLLWIMTRLGIQFNINFGKPVVRGGKLLYEVSKYDELKALKALNVMFKKLAK
jgi:hypothetical protein